MSIRKLFLSAVLLVAGTFQIFSEKFVHPTDVVKKVKENFAAINSYQAEFSILTERKDQKKYTRGMVYYKKAGKVNFSFTSPMNDVIISNGKKLWVYINRLNAVTVQDLEEGKSAGLTDSVTGEGVISLFTRYHYSFDDVNQPVKSGKSSYYVLALREKVASGGFTQMKVYIDSETYFIQKIEAESPGSKKMSLTLSNVQKNLDLPNSLFQFNITDSMKVVENALTTN